jgi:hypothetical protein
MMCVFATNTYAVNYCISGEPTEAPMGDLEVSGLGRGGPARLLVKFFRFRFYP